MLNYSIENLMLYFLFYDPNSALDFGIKTIINNIDDKFKSKMRVYIGMAEMLKDDILEAKDFLV